MIENTDTEQLERANDRIVELLREKEVLVKALEEIEDLGANGATAARLGNIAHAALITSRGRHS